MSDAAEGRWVEIDFDCLPLRTVGRLDVPMDASPRFKELCLEIKAAIDTHGSHNSYFLYNASCTYHLTNRAEEGAIKFGFRGTVFTDEQDAKTVRADLKVALKQETCELLSEPVIHWFESMVVESVRVEFDRYIAAGDLQQAQERLQQIQAASDDAGGYLGMYL